CYSPMGHLRRLIGVAEKENVSRAAVTLHVFAAGVSSLMTHGVSADERLFRFRHSLKQREELGGFHDLNALIVPKGEEMPVATDEVLSLPDNGTFQHGIIIGIC